MEVLTWIYLNTMNEDKQKLLSFNKKHNFNLRFKNLNGQFRRRNHNLIQTFSKIQK